MKGIYFGEKGAELLEKMGMTKSEFARRMGIQRQNVNALFKTSNLEIIAKVCYTDKPKSNNKNQSKFERMLVMKCVCPGIGQVRLIVGVRRRDKTKIQYCITALTPIFANKKKQPRV